MNVYLIDFSLNKPISPHSKHMLEKLGGEGEGEGRGARRGAEGLNQNRYEA